MRKTVPGFSDKLFLGIISYWTLVFSGIFKVTELVPGHRSWFMSFPLPDGWIAIVSLLAFIFLLQGKSKASLFGLLAGSSLIFLGLYALMYGINTGLLFHLTVDELIEIAIKAYCLSVGTFLIVYFWKYAKESLMGLEKYGRKNETTDFI